MSFASLPALFPRLSYLNSQPDVIQDSSHLPRSLIVPSQTHGQNRIRRESDEEKFISDVDREEHALDLQVIYILRILINRTLTLRDMDLVIYVHQDLTLMDLPNGSRKRNTVKRRLLDCSIK